MEDLNLTSGYAASKSGMVSIGYFLSYFSFWDFNDLKNKAAAKHLANGGTGSGPGILAARYADLSEGYYPVEITYSLPGTKQVTFRKEITIKF